MNISITIPFLWGSKPSLTVEIDASVEAKFHLRAAVEKAVTDGANLTRANLYGANLYGANLYGANLTRANLTRANLTRANLDGANLYGANLDGANLDGANLYGANLYGANLTRANLTRANLDGANLTRAKNLSSLAAARISIVPEVGAFEGFKSLQGGAVAHLLIPADAKRSNATERKCRASSATVLSIVDANGKPVKSGKSHHDPKFIYRVGETVTPDSFDEDRFKECAPGIHFFLTRIEAEKYW